MVIYLAGIIFHQNLFSYQALPQIYVNFRSCILEWIKKGKKECPNCKKKTKNSDVRKIYPATMPLVVRDNSENEGLRKKIEVFIVYF